MTLAAPFRGRLGHDGLLIALGAAALILGAMQGYLSFAVHPLFLPALVAAGAVLVVSLSRPEVGVAVALVLLTAGRLLPGPLPAWLPTLALSGFLFVLALRRFSGTRGEAGRLPRLTLPLVGFFAVTLMSFVAGGWHVGEALPVFRALLTGFLLFFAISVLLQQRRQFAWVVAGAAGAAAVLAYHAAVLDSSSIGYITNSGAIVPRATAGFASPNTLGGFLAPLVPVALAGVVLVPAVAPLFLAAAGAASYGVYLSLSRGALLGLVVAPFIALRSRWLFVVAPLVVAAAVTLTPAGLEQRVATINTQDENVAGREDIWRVAGAVFLEHPVLGAGPGGFPRAYAESPEVGKEFLGVLAVLEHPPHAHNLALQMLSEQGLVGLVALVLLFGAALRLAVELRRSTELWIRVVGAGALGALVVLLVHNIVDVTLLEQTAIMVLALLGVLSGVERMTRTTRAG